MDTKILKAMAVLAAVLAWSSVAQSAPQSTLHSFPVQFDDRSPTDEVRATKRSYDVYHHGQYVGSNPDPNIRLQLQRELEN